MITRSSVLYGLVFLLALVFLGSLARAEVIGLKDFATAGMGLAGSFVGALFAFRLNEHREKARETSARKMSLNKALFTLSRQLSSVISLANEMAPFVDDFARAFNCPAFMAPDHSSVQLDYDSLSFLFEDGYENLLAHLAVEDECYRQTLKSLAVRSEFLLKEAQPILGEKGLNGKNVAPSDFVDAVGECIFGTAMAYGRQLHGQVLESEKGLRKVHDELYRAAKSLFPGSKFLKLADSTRTDYGSNEKTNASG